MIYGLDTYTELQIRDWQASERIVLYVDELQFISLGICGDVCFK